MVRVDIFKSKLGLAFIYRCYILLSCFKLFTLLVYLVYLFYHISCLCYCLYINITF